MEGTLVLPVRMCNRRDAIPPINMVVRYILTVCLPVLDICTILYVINSVRVVLGSDLLYNNQLQRTCCIYNIWRTHSVYLVEINKAIPCHV